MADKTHIEWTDATWNPVTGCTIVSAGCTNCYAMGLAGTRLKHHPSRAGLTRISGGRPVWTGKVRLNAEWLDQPLRWRRPRRIFVCAHGDLFHESVPEEWIDRVFAVMALAPHHTFQVLTKRPERMRKYVTQLSLVDLLCVADRLSRVPAQPLIWPLPNVWLGTSIEDQPTADARIPHLLATPAAVRFVSAEPLLGPVDLTRWCYGFDTPCDDCPKDVDCECGWQMRRDLPDDIAPGALDLVIVGGESGANARPMHPDWARSLRDQCIASGVAFHFKQWGEWEASIDRDRDDPDWRADYSRKHVDRGASKWLNLAGGSGFHGERFHVMARVGKRAAGRTLDGRTWDQMPGAGE